jgi:hypothetical protein
MEVKMPQGFDGLAEAQARLYFYDLARWATDLHEAQARVQNAFASLKREYDDVFPRSKLQIYPRCRPLHGPTALYWGDLVSLRRWDPQTTELETRRVFRYLKGPFQVGWVHTIAKRNDRVDRFQDFDRRRLALNDASRAVLSALAQFRNATARKFPLGSSPALVPSNLDPDVRIPVPEIPEGSPPRTLPPRLAYFLRSAWVGAFTLALAEVESSELVAEVGRNPSAGDLRLDLTERRKPGFSRQIRWIHVPTRTVIEKLTDRLMRQLHVKEGIRPVMSLKERKRRRLAKSLARTGAALDALREKCQEAQAAFSEGMEAAKVILLPTSDRESSTLTVSPSRLSFLAARDEALNGG